MRVLLATVLLAAPVQDAQFAAVEDAGRRALVRQALDDLHHEQFDAALEAAAELCRRYPGDPAGPLAAANVYQTRMRDYRVRDHEPEFLAALQEARRLAEARVRLRPDAEAFFARGTVQGYVAIHDARSGRWFPALRNGLRCLGDMERALELDPSLVDAELPMALHDYWKSRKLGLFFGGRRPGAILRMERVSREARYLGVEAAYSLVTVLQGEGRYDEALRMSDWLSERFPANPVALYHRARILEKLGRPIEALRVWDDLVERLSASGRTSHGFLAECHLHRAQIQAAGGGTDRAIDSIRLAQAHAAQRDPRLEMEGPFEDFDEIRTAIARLDESWGATSRRQASR
jgi:tetratricopeptide (TPR) repeat protein